MLKLNSVETIRKQHTFVSDLSSIPTVEWMKPGETDCEISLGNTLEELKVIDKDIETIIRKPDEDMQIALGEAKYLENKLHVRDLRFPSCLPQGKVQLQRDIIKELLSVAIGKKSIARDLDQEMSECAFQGEWESNPRIGKVMVDDKETELRLRNSLGLFSGYLNSCEHEFYKQAINSQLRNIMYHYHLLLEFADIKGEKKAKSKLMEEKEMLFHNFEGVLDRIYYSRARDYLFECDSMWSFLNKNDFTKKYLLKMEDVHPGLKSNV
ncbi:hypothetical protein A3K64_00775 [Candidatus Micrarchaeota archaeon RBG_16_36_9]|nr:MAG: hypothetical protein A3K64_00775 [Candidatus Micrarchaeota archaeon RBG_16_36_9]